MPDFKNLYVQTMPYIKKVVLPSLLLVFLAKIFGNSKKTAFLGIGIGNILLAICLLNSVLLLEANFRRNSIFRMLRQ